MSDKDFDTCDECEGVGMILVPYVIREHDVTVGRRGWFTCGKCRGERWLRVTA